MWQAHIKQQQVGDWHTHQSEGDDMDIGSMITTYNTAVTDTASEIFGKERRRKKSRVTRDVLDLCGERWGPKKRRYEEGGAKI